MLETRATTDVSRFREKTRQAGHSRRVGELSIRRLDPRADLPDGGVFRIPESTCTIGSSKQCDLRLDNVGAHPVHCLILQGTAHTVMRSWNGPFRLNGELVEFAQLRPGDQFEVGIAKFEVTDLSTSAAEPNDKQSKSASDDFKARIEGRLHANKRTRGLINQLREANREIDLLRQQPAQVQSRLDIRRHSNQRIRHILGRLREAKCKIEGLQQSLAQIESTQAQTKDSEIELAQRALELQEQARQWEMERESFRLEKEQWQKMAAEYEAEIAARVSRLTDQPSGHGLGKGKGIAKLPLTERRQKGGGAAQASLASSTDDKGHDEDSMDEYLDQLVQDAQADDSLAVDPTKQMQALASTNKSSKIEDQQGQAVCDAQASDLAGDQVPSSDILQNQLSEDDPARESDTAAELESELEPRTIPMPTRPVDSVSSGSEDEEPEEEVYSPRSLPPERTSNIAAMRDLAQQASRIAIDEHTISSWRHSAVFKFTVSLVAFSTTAILWLCSPGFHSINFFAGAIALIIGLFWAGQGALLTQQVILVGGRDTSTGGEMNSPQAGERA